MLAFLRFGPGSTVIEGGIRGSVWSRWRGGGLYGEVEVMILMLGFVSAIGLVEGGCPSGFMSASHPSLISCEPV